MPRDPPPTKPTIYRITSATTLASSSTLTVGRQQLLVGHNHMISQPPSPYNEDARPYTHSQTTVQAPSSTVDDRRSSEEQRRGRVSRKQSRRSTDSSPMPIDPPQFYFGELQKAQGRSPAHDPRDVARKSDTSLLLEDASQRDIRDTGSGKLSTHETTHDD